jgi:hypothetical protein
MQEHVDAGACGCRSVWMQEQVGTEALTNRRKEDVNEGAT